MQNDLKSKPNLPVRHLLTTIDFEKHMGKNSIHKYFSVHIEFIQKWERPKEDWCLIGIGVVPVLSEYES